MLSGQWSQPTQGGGQEEEEVRVAFRSFHLHHQNHIYEMQKWKSNFLRCHQLTVGSKASLELRAVMTQPAFLSSRAIPAVEQRHLGLHLGSPSTSVKRGCGCGACCSLRLVCPSEQKHSFPPLPPVWAVEGVELGVVCISPRHCL